MKYTILIVDDEKGIAENVSYALNLEGYESNWVNTGQDALDAIQTSKIDLILLDIGLPDISGLELIKKIRLFTEVPVLFLTARKDEIDKVLGLELGADDYITKPFSPREVVARIKAVLRRTNTGHGESISLDSPFIIDNEKFIITYYGQKLALSRYEFKILSLLIQRPGWVFPREKIMDLVWDEPEESFDRTVDTHIKTIRAKLKNITPQLDPILTHRGIGYALKEDLKGNSTDKE